MGGDSGKWKGFSTASASSANAANEAAPIWWRSEEPVPLGRPSFQSSVLADASFPSSIMTAMSDIQSVSGRILSDDKVFVVPVRGTETPLTRAKLPGIHGSSTPEVQRKLAAADPDNVHQVAMRLYKTLKQHGLSTEAERAFRHLNEVTSQADQMDDNNNNNGLKSEGLIGMEYLLKDGIVNYLRDVARITPSIPRQVVRFLGINYSARIQIGPDGYDTFGKKLLGCFLGPFMKIGRKKESVHLQILKDIVGYVMPGSLTLLLGPPGSGKSTLLKILAGRVLVNGNTALEGLVWYNDREASEVVLTRVIAYINGQLNKHIPFLTVRETLEFAEDCTQGLRPENFSPQMRKFFAHALVEGQDPFLEYVMHVLGLKAIEHSLVGPAGGIDGITENDRVSLTTAELALGTYSVMLYDQPCAGGQDSLATFDLVHTLRAISRIQQCSAVMSLVHLSDEVFDLFDRVILLGEGQLLYQGPRQDVLKYFSSLGYLKPSHVESCEFLQDIAAGEGFQYMHPSLNNLSTEGLVQAFKNSDLYRDILRIVYNDDVLHTFWVESEPSLGLSVRNPEPRSYERDYYPDEGEYRGLEVVVAKLSKKVDYTQGIESTGCIQIGDIVTGISTNSGEMQYLAVGTESNPDSGAHSIYMMLRNAKGHVRLQVERPIQESEADDSLEENRQFSRSFIQGSWASTKTLIRRQTKVAKRLQTLITLRMIQVILLGLFTGSLFWHAGGVYAPLNLNLVRGLGFVANMNILLINMVQLPVYMLLRPVYYKQRAQRFFRASSYVLAHSTVNLPQSFAEAFVYSICIYFMAGLFTANHGTRFIQFLLLLFLVCYLGSSLVLLLSAISPILEAANALAGLVVSIFLLFSGFVIYPNNIPVFWKWLYYFNPLHWANLIYCITQMGDRYTQSCSGFLGANSVLGFCNLYPDLSVGHAYLLHFQLATSSQIKYWLVPSYAILIGWILALNMLCVLALNKLKFPEVNHSLPRPKSSTVGPLFSEVEKDAEDASSVSGDMSEGEGSFEPKTPIQQGVHTLNHIHHDQGPGFNNREDALDYDEEAGFAGKGDQLWRASNIPVRPVTLSFYNLIFETEALAGKQRTVLNRVSGWVKPARMLALIGSSKCGKTTLLKVLAGRPPPGKLDGEILANGQKAPAEAYARVVGFVERLDAHQPFLTVRESLYFSATLRVDAGIEPQKRAAHVEMVIQLLGLTSVSNQLVGSIRDAAGRTYEIAKKITIAVEVAANPSILFLDEPTSGLDSVGSRNILSALQTIASTGRTVVSTVQHPSTLGLAKFNNVLILSTGGEQVYFGPIGLNCQDLLRYFAAIPKFGPVEVTSQNPITFVLDVLGAGIRRREPAHNFAVLYRNSALASSNADELHRLRRQNKRHALKPVASAYAAPLGQQAAMVFLRTQRFLWRNVSYTFGRLTGSIALGLLMGSIYFKISYDGTLSLTSRSLYIYMQVMLIGVITSNNVVPQVGSDRLAYYRERRAHMYAPVFYPIAWMLAEIPYILLASLAFSGVGNAMAMIATDSAYNFIMYWLCLFVFTLSVTYFGMLLTLATPQPVLAAFVVSIITSIWITGSGVIVPFQLISKGYKWVFWANPYQYVMNTLTSISFYCNTGSAVCKSCVHNEPCPACPCKQLSDLNYTFAWDRLYQVRSVRARSEGLDIAALLGMGALFAGLALLAFACLKHNAKPVNR